MATIRVKALRYIIISIIFISIGCSKESRVALGPPRIRFCETEFDFGEIEQRKNVTHIFEFSNIGGDTLMIEKVRAP